VCGIHFAASGFLRTDYHVGLAIRWKFVIVLCHDRHSHIHHGMLR